jgi:hypothetical protein
MRSGLRSPWSPGEHVRVGLGQHRGNDAPRSAETEGLARHRQPALVELGPRWPKSVALLVMKGPRFESARRLLGKACKLPGAFRRDASARRRRGLPRIRFHSLPSTSVTLAVASGGYPQRQPRAEA